MREHRYDSEEAALRPKAARVDEPLDHRTGAAAAAGRADVLGEPDVLGLQRAVGNSGVTSLMEDERSPVHDVVASGGRPLDEDVRTDMEGRLGHDFSDVRVHDDAAAHESAAAVSANAYTVGSHVVFQRDSYDPGSDAGRTTLAHELTHVVQQRSGPVDGTPAAGGIRVSDPSDRFEREASATAERAMSQPAPSAPGAALQREADDEAAQDASALTAQREEAAPEEEEEPTAQGDFVQREEATDEEEEMQG